LEFNLALSKKIVFKVAQPSQTMLLNLALLKFKDKNYSNFKKDLYLNKR